MKTFMLLYGIGYAVLLFIFLISLYALSRKVYKADFYTAIIVSLTSWLGVVVLVFAFIFDTLTNKNNNYYGK